MKVRITTMIKVIERDWIQTCSEIYCYYYYYYYFLAHSKLYRSDFNALTNLAKKYYLFKDEINYFESLPQYFFYILF